VVLARAGMNNIPIASSSEALAFDALRLLWIIGLQNIEIGDTQEFDMIAGAKQMITKHMNSYLDRRRATILGECVSKKKG
jgi:hypothetical protein